MKSIEKMHSLAQIDKKKTISSDASSIDFRAWWCWFGDCLPVLLNWWCWWRIPKYCFVNVQQYSIHRDDTPNLNEHTHSTMRQRHYYYYTKFAWLISNCNIRLDCQNILNTAFKKIFGAAKIKAETKWQPEQWHCCMCAYLFGCIEDFEEKKN